MAPVLVTGVEMQKHDSISRRLQSCYQIVRVMKRDVACGALEVVVCNLGRSSSFWFWRTNGFLLQQGNCIYRLWSDRISQSDASGSGCWTQGWWEWSALSRRWRGSDEDGCSPVGCVGGSRKPTATEAVSNLTCLSTQMPTLTASCDEIQFTGEINSSWTVGELSSLAWSHGLSCF